MVDLNNKGITGREAEEALGKARITVNKNVIPYDERPPTVTSGVRLGTPSVTTRGMIETDMVEIAEIMSSVLQNITDTEAICVLRNRVETLCKRFPIYQENSES